MEIIQLFESITVLSILKFMILVLLGVYVIFAFLMMRQISAMTRAVTIRDDYIIRAMGIIHFVFAILVMVIAATLI